jgi:hypothetical protein
VKNFFDKIGQEILICDEYFGKEILFAAKFWTKNLAVTKFGQRILVVAKILFAPIFWHENFDIFQLLNIKILLALIFTIKNSKISILSIKNLTYLYF